MADNAVTVDAGRLTEIARTIFVAAGTPEDTALRVATSLVDANLAGHDSHGVLRIPEYISAIRAGELVATARPEVARETEVSALVSGNWTFGQVTAAMATRVAIDKAKKASLAVVGVTRCHHTGRVGEYAAMAAAEGIILLLMGGGLSGVPLAAPFGGRRAVLGANPLAAGFPVGAAGEPMIVDFATTVVAGGKIHVARAAGKELPAGALLDRDGLPTTNPNDFYNGGMLLPFGGHKGYALALIAEFLVAALVDPGAWTEEGRGGPVFAGSGLFLLAMDPAVLGSEASYARVSQDIVTRVKSVPPAPGFEEVLIPGEPEARTRRQRLGHGIPIEQVTWQALTETAASLDVAIKP